MMMKNAIAMAVQVFGLFLLFCGASTFILPGAVLYILGRKSKKNIELLQSIAGIIISYRRMRINALAAQLMIPEQKTAKLLAAAVEKGLVRGNFDRTTGEFFTEEAEKETAGIRFCPSCGAPLDKIYLKGETIQCRSCGGLAQ